MGRQGLRIIFSILLVGLGVLLLLSNLNLLPWDITTQQWFWLFIFGGGGLAFLAVYASDPRENWWAVIPSFTLLGLSVLVSEIIPDSYNGWSGGLFLGMIGLSFWVIYLTHREFWWAIIPGGVLVTLGLVAGTSDVFGGNIGGAIFFLGLAATFLILYLLPTMRGGQRWAVFPASILGILGFFILIGSGQLAGFIWPLAMILIGGFMVFRSVAARGQ